MNGEAFLHGGEQEGLGAAIRKGTGMQFSPSFSMFLCSETQERTTCAADPQNAGPPSLPCKDRVDVFVAVQRNSPSDGSK